MFALCADQPGPRDVMVTGLGMVTPLGLNGKDSWTALCSGHRAAKELGSDRFPEHALVANRVGARAFGAPVDHDAVRTQLLDRLQTRMPQRATEYRQHFANDCLNNMLALSAMEAFDDAALSDWPEACVIGTSKSSLRAIEDEVRIHRDSQIAEGFPDAEDRWLNAFLPDAPLRTIRWLTQSNGPSSCPVAACATGLISVIEGARLIRAGLCEVCIAGSADAALRPSVLAGFHRLGVLSRSENAAEACKPMDANRDGFVVGEGAAVAILESRRHAERRNANTYGSLATGGWLSDPTGMTQIDTSGTVVKNLVQQLVADSSRPDHIQLHATATESNDLAESNGLTQAFGTGLPPCSASKGATGHLLGAAGSVEFCFAAMSLRGSVIPPSVNHRTLDPACGITLSAAPHTDFPLQSVMKLSLGFGGHIAGAVLRR